jgi:hypothetical protein
MHQRGNFSSLILRTKFFTSSDWTEEETRRQQRRTVGLIKKPLAPYNIVPSSYPPAAPSASAGISVRTQLADFIT